MAGNSFFLRFTRHRSEAQPQLPPGTGKTPTPGADSASTAGQRPTDAAPTSNAMGSPQRTSRPDASRPRISLADLLKADPPMARPQQPAAAATTRQRITMADLLRADGPANTLPAPTSNPATDAASATTVTASQQAAEAAEIVEIAEAEAAEAAAVHTTPALPPRAAARPAVAAPTPKQPAVNSLPSAMQLDLVKTPLATMASLRPAQMNELCVALGAGELRGPPEAMSEQLTAAGEKLKDLDFGRLLAIDHRRYIAETQVFASLPPEQARRLEKAAHVAHMSIREIPIMDLTTGERMTRMDVYFGGTANFRDAKQDLKTAFGGVGVVFNATRDAAELVAKVLSEHPEFELGRIVGASMGGGTAQAFAAGVQSCTRLATEPTLVLLDPQLLNNAQARHATRRGTIPYDYSRPRGVAISLDYDKNPHKGLMDIMKDTGGYTAPGLVHVRLGLADSDGRRDARPRPSGPPGMGYHAITDQFRLALFRFTLATRLAWPTHATQDDDDSVDLQEPPLPPASLGRSDSFSFQPVSLERSDSFSFQTVDDVAPFEHLAK